MDFICGDQLAILYTKLTQWVFVDVLVTDPFPGPTVAFSGCRVTVVLLIVSSFPFGVIFTKPLRRQKGATWVRTGSLWFIGHGASPLAGIEKATVDSSTMALWDLFC
jgi:hypothetical protein